MLPCPWVLQGRVWCARCMVYAVQCCLFVSSQTGFHGHSIPGHLWRRVTAGSVSSGSQGRRDTRRFTAPQEFNRDTQNVEEMPQMSKSSSSQVRIQVAARFTGLHYLVAPQRTIYVVHAWELCEQNLRLKRTGSTFFLDPSPGQYMRAFITDIYE